MPAQSGLEFLLQLRTDRLLRESTRPDPSSVVYAGINSKGDRLIQRLGQGPVPAADYLGEASLRTGQSLATRGAFVQEREREQEAIVPALPGIQIVLVALLKINSTDGTRFWVRHKNQTKLLAEFVATGGYTINPLPSDWGPNIYPPPDPNSSSIFDRVYELLTPTVGADGTIAGFQQIQNTVPPDDVDDWGVVGTYYSWFIQQETYPSQEIYIDAWADISATLIENDDAAPRINVSLQILDLNTFEVLGGYGIDVFVSFINENGTAQVEIDKNKVQIIVQGAVIYEFDFEYRMPLSSLSSNSSGFFETITLPSGDEFFFDYYWYQYPSYVLVSGVDGIELSATLDVESAPGGSMAYSLYNTIAEVPPEYVSLSWNLIPNTVGNPQTIEPTDPDDFKILDKGNHFVLSNLDTFNIPPNDLFGTNRSTVIEITESFDLRFTPYGDVGFNGFNGLSDGYCIHHLRVYLVNPDSSIGGLINEWSFIFDQANQTPDPAGGGPFPGVFYINRYSIDNYLSNAGVTDPGTITLPPGKYHIEITIGVSHSDLGGSVRGDMGALLEWTPAASGNNNTPISDAYASFGRSWYAGLVAEETSMHYLMQQDDSPAIAIFPDVLTPSTNDWRGDRLAYPPLPAPGTDCPGTYRADNYANLYKGNLYQVDPLQQVDDGSGGTVDLAIAALTQPTRPEVSITPIDDSGGDCTLGTPQAKSARMPKLLAGPLANVDPATVEVLAIVASSQRKTRS